MTDSVDRARWRSDDVASVHRYVVTRDGVDGVGALPRFDSATAALRAVVFMRRRDHREAYSIGVEDAAGRRMSWADLLTDATAEAVDTGLQSRLDHVLADYVDAVRHVAMAWAEEWVVDVLDSGDYEAELRYFESQGDPAVADIRQQDARAREQLTRTIRSGAWRDAGQTWGWEFGRAIPRTVLSELRARHGSTFNETDLRAGLREGMTGRADRGDPESRSGPDIDGRPAATADTVARRRAERLQQVLRSASSQEEPPGPAGERPAAGRRP